jgi:V-type H+-transporting ATPase subunit F
MSSSRDALAEFRDRKFLSVIGDEDSVTGLLLAGIGHVTPGPEGKRNFLVVDGKTDTKKIEEAFQDFTQTRRDIGIVLINQHIANRIRHHVEAHKAAFPTVIEIPSKDHPYDPSKDSLMTRVEALMGAGR